MIINSNCLCFDQSWCMHMSILVRKSSSIHPRSAATVEPHPSDQWLLQTFFIVSLVSKFIVQATRPSQSAARVRTLVLLFCLSVCFSSWEVTFRSSNGNIACSTATSLSPLMGKFFSIVLLYLESHARYIKSQESQKTVFVPKSLTLHCDRWKA